MHMNLFLPLKARKHAQSLGKCGGYLMLSAGITWKLGITLGYAFRKHFPRWRKIATLYWVSVLPCPPQVFSMVSGTLDGDNKYNMV